MGGLMDIKGFQAEPAASICAVKFHRKMRGGSQSSLLQAEDGNYYIVKMLGNPQGSSVLFNEAFGSEIMRLIGLEVPDWSPILVPQQFIDETSSLWFEMQGPGHRRPVAGVHFGSKLVMPRSNENLVEILPRSWFRKVRNRESFVGALLFDLWANQSDARQAVFLQQCESHSISATFIDHGALFGHQDARISRKRIRAMYLDPNIYEEVNIDLTLSKWTARIATLSESVLTLLVEHSGIPAQWYTPENISKTVSRLAERRALLGEYADLIRVILKSRRADRQMESPDERSSEVQIRGAQLCTDGYRRMLCAMPRVG